MTCLCYDYTWVAPVLLPGRLGLLFVAIESISALRQHPSNPLSIIKMKSTAFGLVATIVGTT